MGNFIPAHLKKGSILTYNQEGTRTFEGETIEVVPVWKWLLGAPAGLKSSFSGRKTRI
jgi:hypothetical protein